MARLELRRFNTVTHLLILAESESESVTIDSALGSKIPTPVQGEVTLADGYAEHYIRLYRVAAKDDNYWRWQGDGHDNLESLTCSVMIQAQQLLVMSKAITAARALITSTLAHVSHGGPTREDAEKLLAQLNGVKL